MPASQPANFNLQEFSDVGQLLAGGRLYTYAYGTTAQKVAYTDPDGTVPHTYTPDGVGGQYIALNARGELPAPLYLGDGSYDISLKRADGSTVWTRKADGVENSNKSSLAALAASAGAALIGFIHAAAGAIARTVQDKLRDSVSVLDFMTPAQIADVRAQTLTLDVVAAIQAAIDYATTRAGASYPATGVGVIFPPGRYRANSPITLKQGVMLVAGTSMRGGGAAIVGYGQDIVTTPATVISATGIDGVSLIGGNGTVRNALRLVNVNDSRFANFSTNNTQDQGILALAGVANSYSNLLVVNAVLNRVRAAPIGAFELRDFDPIVHSVEAAGHAGGTTTVSSPSCYIAAILAASSEGFYSQCIGEFGDVGIRATGSNNRFSNCRADTTMGHGVVNSGGQNQFSALEVLNPAMDPTADTYDGVQNSSTNSVFAGVTIQKTSGARGRYGFNGAAFSEINVRSSALGVSINQGAPGFLAKYNIDLSNDGVMSLALPPSGYITDRGTSATLDLSRATNIRLFPAAPTSYNAVSGAIPGQIYTFILNDQSTLANTGGKIVTKDGANIVGGGYGDAWKIVQFFAYTPTWIREIGR